jgi:hypothetical protein
MELWSNLLIHHLHQRHQNSFADPAGCSSYGALHATCKDEEEAPRIGAHKQITKHPRQNRSLGSFFFFMVPSPPRGGRGSGGAREMAF